jgi:nucleoside-diphosphate-sugar epimerase
MGVHLVQLLTGQGHEVVVTSRADRESEGMVRYVKGNAQNMDFLQTILHQHWDAIVDFMVYSTRTFEDRVDTLLNATSHYVFLSSSRVYAESENPITEESPRLLDVSFDKEYLATDEYSLSKARQEDLLKRSGRSNWTIIRPYITYSKNRLQLGVLEKEEWLYRALHGRTIVFSDEINSKFTTLTFGRDVSNALTSIIGNAEVAGEVFHITTERSIKWSGVLALYLDVLEKHLGRRPKVMLQSTKRFMECKPSKYQILYDRLFDRTFDCSKIRKYVETSDFMEIDAGLANCLKQFLADPEFRKVDWILEAIKDRQTKDYSSLMEIEEWMDKLYYILFRYFGFPVSFRRLARRIQAVKSRCLRGVMR